MKSILNVLFLFLSILFAFCKKDKNTATNFQKQKIATESIHNIRFLNDTLGFCAIGMKKVSGEIRITKNGGQTWDLCFNTTDTCLYDICLLNDSTLLACGDHLSLFVFNLNKKTKKSFNYAFSMIPEYDVSLYELSLNTKHEILCVGGEYYDRGVLLKFINENTFWEMKTFTNEIRCLQSNADGSLLVGGYGLVSSTDGPWSNLKLAEIRNDFFVDLHFVDNKNGFLLGYMGNIYQTNDFGKSWNHIFDASSAFKTNTRFNAMTFLNAQVGYACGNNGLLIKTTDGGKSWKKLNPLGDSNLLSLSINNQRILVGDHKGNLYSLKN